MQVWIEGQASGDAEVYVDGLMSHHLRDTDRSFDSTGERFHLVEDATGRVVGTVRPHDSDPVAQIIGLLS